MRTSDVIYFVVDVWDQLCTVCGDVVSWFNTSYDFFGVTFTVSEAMFGVGLIVVLGYIVTKWLIPV